MSEALICIGIVFLAYGTAKVVKRQLRDKREQRAQNRTRELLEEARRRRQPIDSELPKYQQAPEETTLPPEYSEVEETEKKSLLKRVKKRFRS